MRNFGWMVCWRKTQHRISEKGKGFRSLRPWVGYVWLVGTSPAPTHSLISLSGAKKRLPLGVTEKGAGLGLEGYSQSILSNVLLNKKLNNSQPLLTLWQVHFLILKRVRLFTDL